MMLRKMDENTDAIIHVDSYVSNIDLNESIALMITSISLESMLRYIEYREIDVTSIDNQKLHLHDPLISDAFDLTSNGRVNSNYLSQTPCNIFIKFLMNDYRAKPHHFLEFTSSYATKDPTMVCVPDRMTSEPRYYKDFNFFKAMYDYFPAMMPYHSIILPICLYGPDGRQTLFHSLFANDVSPDPNATASEKCDYWYDLITEVLNQVNQSLRNIDPPKPTYGTGKLSTILLGD
jgi:hypothetical protein